MVVRQCPICLSIGTLSPSHRRDSHETFLAVTMSFVRPFRCSACNWRGMMGRISLARHRNLNITINGVIYVGILILAIYLLATLRERLHPS